VCDSTHCSANDRVGYRTQRLSPAVPGRHQCMDFGGPRPDGGPQSRSRQPMAHGMTSHIEPLAAEARPVRSRWHRVKPGVLRGAQGGNISRPGSSSRGAPYSSGPAARITTAAPNNVTAAPTPMNSVLLIALRKKNALAITVSTMPIVKMNSARPRRLRLE